MSAKKKADPVRWYVKRRTYPRSGKSFVSLWLVRRDGPCDAAFLWGEMVPAAATEVIAALGLPVEDETSPIDEIEPAAVPGCVSVGQQQSLFGD